MRNRRNITPFERQQIQALQNLSSRINRIQWIKMGLAMAIILPVLISLIGNFNFLPIEISLGYLAMNLIALNYYFIQDFRLSNKHHELKTQLNAHVAKKQKQKRVHQHTVGTFSGYPKHLVAIG